MTWDVWREKYDRYLRAFAKGFVGERWAEDLYQELLLKTWEASKVSPYFSSH
jgi:DNA-directed RNA polymerase specialized sigma24 family protein